MPDLKAKFTAIAKELNNNEATIMDELNNAQGDAQNIGGYYNPTEKLTYAAMQPSGTLNSIINSILELV